MRFKGIFLSIVLCVFFAACGGGGGGGDDAGTGTPAVPSPASTPSFSRTVADQNYTQGIAISPLPLPGATDGNGTLTYSINPVSPFGLTLNSSTRVLSGTPTGTGSVLVTYRVRDEDGDTDIHRFNISVRAPQTKNICSRTPQVWETILAKIQETDRTVTCSTVNEAHLAGITELDLSAKSIVSLQTDDLDDLSGLTELLLNDNDLTALPEDVFEGLSNLERINLNDNELTSLSEDVFEGLSSLVELRLRNNMLRILPSGLFDGLSGLTDLSLSGNLLDAPPAICNGPVVTCHTDNEVPSFAAGTAIDNQDYINGVTIDELQLPAAEVGSGNGDLTYSITPASPFGLTFNPDTRTLSGTPAMAGGPLTVTYTARDADENTQASDQDTLQFTINVAEDTAPGFDGQMIGDLQYVPNSAITPVSLPAATGGNGPLIYSLSSRPDGFDFNADTRVLSGIPTAVGITDMTYTARDVDGDEITLTFTIEIIQDAMPGFAGQTIADRQYVQNVAIETFELPAASGGNGTLTYSLAPLPDGILFNGVTRELSGSPTTVGITSLTYTARDEDGDEEELTFMINVAEDTEPGFGTASITAPDYISGIAITPLDLPEATGGNAPLEYSLTDLPSGLRLESGQLVGTPAEVVSGQTATYTATDVDGDVATLTFMITVAANDAPSFADDNAITINAIKGIAFTAEALPEATTEGNGASVYSVESRPSWLTFTPGTRVLSGTPPSDAAATTTLTYRVHDADGDTSDGDSDTLTVTLNVADNEAPSFAAGAGIDNRDYINGVAIDELELPAAEVGSGNGDLTYSITPASPFGLTFNLQTRTLSGTPAMVGGPLAITYMVVDADGDMTSTDEATLQFTINVAEDTEPGFDGQMIGDLQYVPSSAITPVPLPQASGGNAPLTYSLSSRPDGFDFNAETRVLSGTPTTVGITDMTYRATDVDGDEITLTFTIEIIQDAMPGFAGQTIADRQYVENVAITTLELPAASGGNGTLTYSLAPLPDGIVFNSGTRELSGTPTAVGSTSLTYTARDEDGDEEELTFTINVAEDTEPGFGTASITAPDYISGIEVTPLDLPEATGGNAPLEYSLSGQPAGLSLTGGQLTGTPAEVVSGQTATYTATDVDGDVATLTFMITVAANDVPSFADDNAITINAIKGIEFTAEALPEATTEGNGASVYSVESRPSWLTFTPGTRELSGTPPSDADATTTLTYRVHDADGDTSDGDSDTLTVTLNVADNDAPMFASGATINDQNYIDGVAIDELELPAAEVGSGNGNLSYSIDPVSPFGLTFNSETRTLSGTPAMAGGPETVTYTVVDADGDMASTDEVTLTFTITVAGNTMPSFGTQTVDPQNYIEDTAINTVTLPAATGGNGPLTYNLTPELPAGLTFAPAADTRTISGAPAVAQSSTEYTYTAADADGDESTLTFNIMVTANDAPSFASGTGIDDQNYINGVAIAELQLPEAEAGSGNGDLSYSIDPVSPFGLTFNSETRTLSGTPAMTGGPETVTYTVVDADGDTTSTDESTLTFTITVAADTPPSFGVQTVPAQNYIEFVPITPVILPEASDGNGILSYSLTPLPDGLTFDSGTRELSGLPTATGTTAMTYTAADADGDTAELEFDINTRASMDISICGRTMAVQDAIIADLADDQGLLTSDFECGEITEDDLSSLSSLTVRSATPVSLQAGDFAGLFVTSLTLRNIGLTSLPADVFSELAAFRLTDLDLSNNELTSLPAGLFDGLESLTTLDLRGNPLDGTPAICSDPDVTCLEDLRPSFGGRTVPAQEYIEDLTIDTLPLPEASSGDQPLTYSLAPTGDPDGMLPAGLSFDSGTRELSGTPTVAGTTAMTYTVRDADGDTDTLTVTINIADNTAPSFAVGTTIDNQSYMDGTAIPTLTLPQATGGNGDLSYSITPASPFGLTFDPATQMLSGTPTSAGMETITYKVVDADGDMTATDESVLQFTINVAEDTEPSFGEQMIDDQSYINGIAISPLDLPEATGGNAPLEYSFTELPAGLRLEGGQLVGTPAEVVTDQAVTYTVMDADGDLATLEFDVSIREPRTKSICLRTFRVRTAILANINGADPAPNPAVTCSTITELHLAGITTLTVSGLASPLQADDFEGLSGLTALDLSNGTNLQFLPADLFDGLSSLTTLNLENNFLGAFEPLPEDLFDGLLNLTQLNLRVNYLGGITDFGYNYNVPLPEDLFDGLENLQTLDMFTNSLKSLPEDLFDGLENLQTLILWRNELTTLPEDVFDGLSGLTELNIRYNGLDTLPEDVFDGLSGLESLNLSRNDLSTIPEDVFDGLSGLTTLRLDWNTISSLPADVFEGLSALTALDLNRNSLTALPEDVFDGLSALTTLDLYRNSLTTLPADVFNGVSGLTGLRLDRNMISTLPADVFDGLSALTTLDLSHNDLTVLPAGLFDGLTSLTTLDLSDNTVVLPPICDETTVTCSSIN